MPRVTLVKAARKANPVAQVGESYYWWKFRYGGKRFSKTPPRPSQLTQSAYIGGIRSLVEQVEDAEFAPGQAGHDAFIEMRDDICSQLEELGSEADESLQNMPEGLQQGDTGQLLEARYEACEQAQSEISCMEPPYGWDTYDDDSTAYNEWVDTEPDCDPESQEYQAWEADDPGDPDDTVEEEWGKDEIIDLLNSAEEPY